MNSNLLLPFSQRRPPLGQLLLYGVVGWSMWVSLATASHGQTPPSIFESVTLKSNFQPNPLVLNGISGGTEPAARIVGVNGTATGPCIGYIDREPDHQLILHNRFRNLQVQVQSDNDTTLVVSGPGGVWCNDDGSDQNPAIAGEWQTGIYKLWIGSFKSDVYYPYRLQICHRP